MGDFGLHLGLSNPARYCTCEDGYYGYDCSNTSCPGDYCWYHEYSHEQVCQHCCSAGYNHTDDDVYIDNADSNKVCPRALLTQVPDTQETLKK